MTDDQPQTPAAPASGKTRLDLKNPALIGWLGVVLAILAIGVPLAVDAWRNRLALTVETTSSVPLVNSELPGRLSVLVDGVPAQRVWITTVKVQNSGRRPIEDTMFATGTSLDLFMGRSCRVIESNVDDLATGLRRGDVKVTVQEGGVSIAPLLLNPGDWFRMKVLTSNCQPSVDPSARIRDIAKIREVTPLGRAVPSLWSSLAGVIAMFPLLLIVRVVTGHMESGALGRWQALFIVVLVLISIVLQVSGSFFQTPLFTR